MIKQTVTFTLNDKRISITLSTERDYVSFTGVYDGAAGQVQKTIAQEYALCPEYIPELETIMAAWRDYHLKPVLAAESAMDGILSALKTLDGSRYPGNEEGGFATDFEECKFSNTDDTIDSRDVISRIEYLTTFLIDIPDATPENYEPDNDPKGDRSKAVEELKILKDLERQGSSYAPDWQYGETMIHENHFTEYAEQLVKDIADLPRDIPKYIVIDWEATAENLKVDYTTINFDGETYYIR